MDPEAVRGKVKFLLLNDHHAINPDKHDCRKALLPQLGPPSALEALGLGMRGRNYR